MGVTGANRDVTEEALAGLPVILVYNGDWTTGMASSIRCGIEHVEAGSGDDTAAIIMTCDQPMLTAKHLKSLVSEMESTGAEIVASAYSQTLATPAVFTGSISKN